MNCMKCGRELESEQVFCDDCLLDMEKYPVKPGTSIQLPRRRESSPVKKPAFRRKAPPLEEQVKNLKQRLRIITALLVLMTLLAAALAYPAITHLMEDHYRTGQNYSSSSRAETTAN